MFDSILYESLTSSTGVPFSLSWPKVFLCMAIALVAGLVVAIVYRFSSRNTSRSFMTTLVLVPPVMTSIIPLCSASLGVGFAMAGIFGLVRFRSVPGNARDIATIFLCVVCGVLSGLGFVAVAGIVVLLGCLIIFSVSRIRQEDTDRDRELRIVIPEQLDYTEAFDDLFDAYTEECRLVRVKTTNMGAMYELRYRIRLKETASEKKFIDEIRVRNGNMTVMSSALLEQDTESL